MWYTSGFYFRTNFIQINMIDLFYECKDSNVASFADDTTPYFCATDIPSVAFELQASQTKLFHWLKNHHLKVNPGKSHILLGAKKPEIVSVDGISLAASYHEKLLEVIIDSELKFENHITVLCLKVSKKINALCRISSFIIRKTQNINESIYRISIQLLSLDMDASF